MLKKFIIFSSFIAFTCGNAFAIPGLNNDKASAVPPSSAVAKPNFQSTAQGKRMMKQRAKWMKNISAEDRKLIEKSEKRTGKKLTKAEKVRLKKLRGDFIKTLPASDRKKIDAMTKKTDKLERNLRNHKEINNIKNQNRNNSTGIGDRMRNKHNSVSGARDKATGYKNKAQNQRKRANSSSSSARKKASSFSRSPMKQQRGNAGSRRGR